MRDDNSSNIIPCDIYHFTNYCAVVPPDIFFWANF